FCFLFSRKPKHFEPGFEIVRREIGEKLIPLLSFGAVETLTPQAVLEQFLAAQKSPSEKLFLRSFIRHAPRGATQSRKFVLLLAFLDGGFPNHFAFLFIPLAVRIRGRNTSGKFDDKIVAGGTH